MRKICDLCRVTGERRRRKTRPSEQVGCWARDQKTNSTIATPSLGSCLSSYSALQTVCRRERRRPICLAETNRTRCKIGGKINLKNHNGECKTLVSCERPTFSLLLACRRGLFPLAVAS